MIVFLNRIAPNRKRMTKSSRCSRKVFCLSNHTKVVLFPPNRIICLIRMFLPQIELCSKSVQIGLWAEKNMWLLHFGAHLTFRENNKTKISFRMFFHNTRCDSEALDIWTPCKTRNELLLVPIFFGRWVPGNEPFFLVWTHL